MLDWKLFLILVLISVPGILVTLPRLLSQMEGMMGDQLAADAKRPSRSAMLAAGVGQYLFLTAIPAALGVWLAPQVGLTAPFFTALAAGDGTAAASAAAAQLLPALLLGSAGAFIFLAAYYGFFQSRFDPETRQASEKTRIEMGIAARLLYGGVFEEIFARWGLMTLLAWIGLKLVGDVNGGVMWAAIVVAGIVFGLSHVPNYAATGSRMTPFFLFYMLVMNLWASLVFGWLFWQHGLLAAMLAHMLFHLWWWPFDLLMRDEYTAVSHRPDFTHLNEQL